MKLSQKTGIITLFLFLISISSVAADNWVYDANEVTMDLSISSSAEINPSSSNYRVDYVSIDLSFFPKESSQQQVLSISTLPSSEKSDDLMSFKWDSPSETKLNFKLESEINVKNDFPKITKSIVFPLPDISGYGEYTNPTGMIDSDSQPIIDLASKLAEGENDEYSVVFKFADWVRENTKYDLNTLTANTVEKASWVLENKEGVCDEITNLFIALNRAVGIPARYVSGVAYTNFNDKNDWGPHAWAEVYFPDFGWVPFDVTYGQLGFVDLTHIILKYSKDSDEPSTNFEWKGVNIDLETSKLNIVTKLKNKQGSYQSPIKFKVSADKEEVGFGSYNLIKAEVENTGYYYISEEFYISVPEELSITGDKQQRILLKPREKKEVYWIVKLDSNLNKDYVYTFPVMVYSAKNESSQAMFASSYKDVVYSKEEIQQIYSEINPEEEKTYSAKISLSCISNKKTVNIKESAVIECTVKNLGNVAMDGLKVCLSSDCKTADIPLNQEKKLSFTFHPTEIGKKSVIITAKNNYVSESSSIVFDVLDTPSISIGDISNPQQVKFNQDYILSFVLNKTSFSDPQKVRIELSINSYKEEWEIDSLSENRKININLKAMNLNEGENTISIAVSYKDKDGKDYSVRKESKIYLINLTFFEKIQVWLNNAVEFVKNIFV